VNLILSKEEQFSDFFFYFHRRVRLFIRFSRFFAEQIFFIFNQNYIAPSAAVLFLRQVSLFDFFLLVLKHFYHYDYYLRVVMFYLLVSVCQLCHCVYTATGW
jgi:hypothetical protein